MSAQAVTHKVCHNVHLCLHKMLCTRSDLSQWQTQPELTKKARHHTGCLLTAPYISIPKPSSRAPDSLVHFSICVSITCCSYATMVVSNQQRKILCKREVHSIKRMKSVPRWGNTSAHSRVRVMDMLYRCSHTQDQCRTITGQSPDNPPDNHRTTQWTIRFASENVHVRDVKKYK